MVTDELVGLRIHILDSETTTETDALAKKYNVSKEQSIVILDKKGAIFFKHTGLLEKEVLKQKLTELRWYKKMTVKIFSTTTCPYCRMVKDYLTSKNVSFEEKLVDSDEKAREEMAQVSGGFLGVPFTVITKDNGQVETVLGFDKGKLDSLIM